MRCKNCGSIDFIKTNNIYECAFCGKKYQPKIIPQQKKTEVPIEEKNKYSSLKAYLIMPSVNSDKIRECALEILKSDENDAVSICLLAFLDREKYPENYKKGILILDAAKIESDTLNFLVPFLLENSEYIYLDELTRFLENRGLYQAYSKKIKEKHKEKNLEEKITLVVEDDIDEADDAEIEISRELLLKEGLTGKAITPEALALALFKQGENEKAFTLLDSQEKYDFERLTNYYIARCFENGYGTEKSIDMAKYFYNLAENGKVEGNEENSSESYYLLAKRYLEGGVIERDEKHAYELFKRSASCGHTLAKYNLGICYKTGMGTEKSIKKAIECFEGVAKKMPSESHYQLGSIFDSLGGKANDKEAVKSYLISAANGNDKSMTNLGIHYYYGTGVERDYKEAVKWYLRASKKGNSFAQYNLGRCYYIGKGVPKDLVASREWFEKSASGGNKQAKHYIIDNF